MPTFNGEPYPGFFEEQQVKAATEVMKERKNPSAQISLPRQELLNNVDYYADILSKGDPTVAAMSDDISEKLKEMEQRFYQLSEEQRRDHMLGNQAKVDPTSYTTDTVTVTTNASSSNGIYWVNMGDQTEHTQEPEYYDENQCDYLSVSEFKDFIYDLIERKGGALPDFNDWKEIKTMLDRLPEDREPDIIDPEEDAISKESCWKEEYSMQWESPKLTNDLQGCNTNTVTITTGTGLYGGGSLLAN